MQTDSPITHADLLDRAKAIHEQIRGWRREIHRFPELGFTETRTAGLVNATLIDLGIDTETEVAKTGVIGHIRGGAGPLVALRADMDALPITELNGTDFDSSRPGIMHACGHDSHTAMLLGAATLLKGLADEGRLPGSVRLLFQPSEEGQDDEGKSGGMRMVEEDSLAGVDAVFGLHVDPQTPVGMVGSRPGPMMAAADMFELVLRGKAGHAARPQSAIDTVVLAAHAIQSIHQVVSRRLNPTEPGVITIGTINGGTKDNIIADTVTMTGTIRSFSVEARQLLHDELRRACGVVEPLGGTFELTIYPGYPPTVNDPEATAIMREATAGLLGDENYFDAPMIMGAEDFSFMAQEVPGCFLRLGTHNPTWPQQYPVHTPTFRMDEDALPIGSASLAAAALGWMVRG
ncbi:MAG: amidohydrolase [Caldilineaceae bacterium]|nr:amidohydrolase [Caldilineaceae bacterium]MBP8109162.1 amidohydrolase [Caldilineaceae bacterium]MBP8124463.1 amidohydrolase [Caldilineaceae bacterium]MBP9071198.1 amidohydrolase [Caldilineaceae bacterium]